MKQLNSSLLELIRKTSCELPKDVASAIYAATKREASGSRGRYAMDIICENLKIAGKKSQPICQDTGSILFFVKIPVVIAELALPSKQSKLCNYMTLQLQIEEAAKWAVAEATAKGYLRQNSVDPLTGKNSGNNLGPGSPVFHFESCHPRGSKRGSRSHTLDSRFRGNDIKVSLILKGGGCENCGTQYSLPDKKLNAQRDIDGVRKCILDAVLQAQGKGCGPGILGVCIGGDRATGYACSKEQLLRKLDDKNKMPALAKLEREVIETSNKLGIGPMGFGGATTLLGCKIGLLNRLPASFFVSISYMCWADRRQGVELDKEGKITKWIY